MVKQVNAIKTTDTSDWVKKAFYDTKIDKIERKAINHDHDEYITTQKFNISIWQGKRILLNSDFDDKLINLNKKVT